MSEDQAKFNAAYRKVLARAWSDPAYKAQLLADPNAILAAASIPIPPDVTIKIVENSEKVVHLVLPQPIQTTQLSEEELEQIAAGSFPGCDLDGPMGPIPRVPVIFGPRF